jgi:polygalacturonase
MRFKNNNMPRAILLTAAGLMLTVASFAQTTATVWKTSAEPLAEMEKLRKIIKSPVFKNADYPVTKYGAMAGGVTNNTEAFKKLLPNAVKMEAALLVCRWVPGLQVRFV